MSTSVGADRFTWSFLDELRQDGDPEADAAVATFIDDELDGDLPADRSDEGDDRAPRQTATKHRRRSATFVAGPPSTARMGRPRADRGTARTCSPSIVPQFGLALWMASIPAGYAGAKDAVVLERTAQLVSHPKRRFLETGQFVLDVMTKGGLDDAGNGAADIRHVRLMHAAVRHMLQHEDHGHDP